MSPTPANTSDSIVTRQQAAKFAAELIISRRHIQSYPQDHPVVAAALQKTISSLTPLISGGRVFTLGVSRQGLLFQNETLSPEMGKFREFSDTLSSFGIIAISFTEGLRPDELLSFASILNRPRNEVWDDGGIKQAFVNAGIQGMRIQVIDPSVFILSDDLDADYQTDPWEIFVRKLLAGFFSISAERLLELIGAPPGELAGEFGAIIDDIPEETHQQAVRSMAEFFVAMGERHVKDDLREEILDKIAAFVAGLPLELRRDFILNICKASESMPGFSEELFLKMPGDGFLEAMQSIATHGGSIPEMLLKLMQRLSSQSVSLSDLDKAFASPESAEKVQVLLRESSVEKFVPPAYQHALMSILSTDTLPTKSMEALEELNNTFEYNRLEGKIGDIISEIIKGMPAGERGEGIRNNLLGLASHHLLNGDFHSLERTCRIIIDEGNALESMALFDPGFIQEILDAATVLGRDKFQDMRSIIITIGDPFVVPLMERLFIEENRSLRRFWFDCLSDLGEMTRYAALERLNDERWFVVRNLTIILRAFNDQEVQRQVRRLINHPHPKVCKEAMKNLLSYGDQSAEKLLLQELDGKDPERKLMAVQVAEISRNPQVVDKLLAIIDSSGIRDFGLELKISAVQALAGIGDTSALPKLNEILFTGRLLHQNKLAQLKTAIIRALPRYPAPLSRPILEDVVAKGGKALAQVAAETLRTLPGDSQ